MQIDGHHTLTYVVARIAGMTHQNAEKLAYCSQYVDEATNVEPVIFENEAMFNRIASAHKMLDYRNTIELKNHLAWIPFHFLPGNNCKSSNDIAEGKFINRLICKPDSFVARDMLKTVAKHKQSPYGLHMFGIAMHVYADTFSHQGFAGVSHEINNIEIKNIIKHHNDDGFFNMFMTKIDNFTSNLISSISPLGHGPALSLPDLPYISWEYTDNQNNLISKNNTDIFMDAANAMYKAIKCYLNNDLDMKIDAQDDLPEKEAAIIRKALIEINDKEGEDRHKKWLQYIKDDKFGFGAVDLKFEITGKNSWKEIARGKAIETEKNVKKYIYNESFLDSDWKYFHDALKTYRIEIVRDVLPRYGICVA